MNALFSPEYDSGETNTNKTSADSAAKPWISWMFVAVTILFAAGEGYYCWSMANRIHGLETAMRTRITAQDTTIQHLRDELGMHEVTFTNMEGALSLTKAALSNTQTQVQKEHKFSDDLAKQEKDSTDHFTGQLGQMQQDQDTTKRVVGSLSTDVSATRTDLDSTKTDLQRTMGDLGVQSGLIARNGQELQELKQRGERVYVEFDLRKSDKPQRFGDAKLGLQLKKTDLKQQKYTVELVSDDRTIEKKDKNTNEPVQFYQGGNRIPSEIVVNQIFKDRIVGYISAPRMETTADKSTAISTGAPQQPSGS